MSHASDLDSRASLCFNGTMSTSTYRTPDRIYPGDTIVTNGDLAQQVTEVKRFQDDWTIRTTIGTVEVRSNDQLLVIKP